MGAVGSMEGVALFSFGYCPFQTWMHFCIYNGPSSQRGFPYLLYIKLGEVINVMFNFKVTFTIWSCINHTLFVGIKM